MGTPTPSNVALVGLGFGAEFIPIYRRHPHAKVVALCQRSTFKRDALADKFGIAKNYSRVVTGSPTS